MIDGEFRLRFRVAVEQAYADASDALRAVFGSVRTEGGSHFVDRCPCGSTVSWLPGLMGSDGVVCKSCGRAVLDILGPFSSPFLDRGNAYVTRPADWMVAEVEAQGYKMWLCRFPSAENKRRSA